MQMNQNKILNSNPTFDFKKYIRLFKRKKWTIISTFIITFFIVFLFLVVFGPKNVYTVSGLLQLNDTRALSGMEVRGRVENDSKVGMMMSRSFLINVVEKEALNVVSYDVPRSKVIDSVEVKDGSKIGEYTIEKEDDNFKMLYTSFNRSTENEVVLEGKFPSDGKISYSGLTLYLRKSFWEVNKSQTFSLSTKEEAVEELRFNLVPSFVNPRSNTLLAISLSGEDPWLITSTLNTLIDEFISENINIKKFHTREVVNILSEQLKTAKQDLDIAVNELKAFREKNPWVGLSASSSGVLTGISSIESQKLSTEGKRDELEMLLKRYQDAPGESKYLILNEILSFLSAQGLPTVPALSSEFARLNSERNNLLSSFAETHPVVEENKTKLDVLASKVMLTANNQLQNYASQVGKYNRDISSENSKIRRLPAKEMEFAELQRKQNIADQGYSSLLVRYNQAKVADAVEVGDIIALDYAVVPQLEGRLKAYAKYFIIALFMGLGLSFGIVLIGDFFDKTVRTSDELMKILPIKVVAKIPVIGSEKEVLDGSFNGTKRIDPKLVTADYSPTAMGEEYRALRTQILFARNQQNIRSLFVTSLDPNEGKSLNTSNIAITFAQQKIPTLLVDADLRRGVLHSSFACKKKPGLADFLYSNADINDENIQKVIQQTHIPNLYLMTSGIPVPNPSEILGSQRAKDIFKFLSDRFGFVIVDTPPVKVTTDSVVISRYVDSGIFVVRAGKTNIEDVKAKVAQYDDFKEHLFGFILNCVETEDHKDSYKYSYYNY